MVFHCLSNFVYLGRVLWPDSGVGKQGAYILVY